MYIKIDAENYQKIQSITMTDYEEKGGYIPAECIESIILDLIYEYEHLEEEFEDFKQDVQDNYRQIEPAEMYDI